MKILKKTEIFKFFPDKEEKDRIVWMQLLGIFVGYIMYNKKILIDWVIVSAHTVE